MFSWVFKAPEAVLYDADGNMVGIHYAGPTWETESGSKVVGKKIASAPVAGTIPWLLLQAVSAEGPGVLANTTYIQRVKTTGGTAPADGRCVTPSADRAGAHDQLASNFTRTADTSVTVGSGKCSGRASPRTRALSRLRRRMIRPAML